MSTVAEAGVVAGDVIVPAPEAVVECAEVVVEVAAVADEVIVPAPEAVVEAVEAAVGGRGRDRSRA